MGGILSTFCSSFWSHSEDNTYLKRFGNVFADVVTNIRFKNMIRSDIEANDLKKLINDLKDYETYPVHKLRSEVVYKLYLYALTNMFSNKIYEDFIRRTTNGDRMHNV
jgi:hypothetical protein